MTDRAARLADEFRERTGVDPAGIWRAPGRVNLIGEHTDYSDGFVMPFAIDRDAYVAARLREDGVVRCASLQLGVAADVRVEEIERGGADGWESYVHGVVAVLREGVGSRGLDILVDSNVPPGAGLSSSAALECATALAVADLNGASMTRSELALAAQRAEIEYAGVPCGVMDQMASMHGRAGHVMALDTRSLEIDLISFLEEPWSAIVIDTRVKHALADSPYAKRRRACEDAARILGVRALRDATAAQVDDAAGALGDVIHRRARHVVTENERVTAAAGALRSGDVEALGELMVASHASLRDDYEVSVAELDAAVASAIEAGAAGARMTGAGFGGSVIAIADAALVPAIRDAVVRRSAREGWVEPHVDTVVPSDGASRLR